MCSEEFQKNVVNRPQKEKNMVKEANDIEIENYRNIQVFVKLSGLEKEFPKYAFFIWIIINLTRMALDIFTN